MNKKYHHSEIKLSIVKLVIILYLLSKSLVNIYRNPTKFDRKL